MRVFSPETRAGVDPRHHVERILGREAAGDFRVARWEPVRLRYGRDMTATWPRHGRAPLRLARQGGLAAIGGKYRVLSPAPGSLSDL